MIRKINTLFNERRVEEMTKENYKIIDIINGKEVKKQSVFATVDFIKSCVIEELETITGIEIPMSVFERLDTADFGTVHYERRGTTDRPRFSIISDDGIGFWNDDGTFTDSTITEKRWL